MDIENIAGNLAGITLGAIYNKGAATTQYNRQRNLMALQLENQQILNQQGYKMQMDMWRNTNYPAQVAMLKEAGLNPGLLYAKGGPGGTTGGQTGGSAGGGQAGQAAPLDISGLMNLKLIESQTAKNNADAKKANADAAKTSGVDTDLANAQKLNVYEQTKMITAQINTESMKQESIKLQNQISEIDRQAKELSLKLDQETFDTKVKTLEANLENLKQTNLKIIAETQSANIDNANKQKLIDQQIQLNNWSMAESEIRIAAARKGIELTDNQIWQIKESVLQGWENVQTNKDALKTSEKNTEALADATIKSAWIVGGLSLGSSLAKMFIPMNFGRTVISGFGK